MVHFKYGYFISIIQMLPNLAFDFITNLHLFTPKYFFFEWRKMRTILQSEVHFLRDSFSLHK